MPKFLEDALSRSADRRGLKGRRKDAYIWGSMNRMGAMRGNKVTEKGMEMERKHDRDMRRGGRRSKRRMARK